MATTFPEIAMSVRETIDWLKAAYGLVVGPSSPLEYTLNLIEIENAYCERRRVAASGQRTLGELRAIRGLEGLCERLRRAAAAPGIPREFARCIRQIGYGAPSLCVSYDDYPMNVFPRTDPDRQAVRRASTDIFELVIGLTALDVGKNVLMSGKDKGKPDVLLDVGGETWGLSCKVTDSTKPRRHFNIVKQAAEKSFDHMSDLTAARSVDRALTVLCIQNVVARDQSPVASYSEAQLSLKGRFRDFSLGVQGTVRETDREQLSLFSDPRIVPGAIAYFEDVFEIITLQSSIVLTPFPPRLDYSPVRYADYATFGDFGQSLVDTALDLAKRLTGPNSDDINKALLRR